MAGLDKRDTKTTGQAGAIAGGRADYRDGHDCQGTSAPLQHTGDEHQLRQVLRWRQGGGDEGVEFLHEVLQVDALTLSRERRVLGRICRSLRPLGRHAFGNSHPNRDSTTAERS